MINWIIYITLVLVCVCVSYAVQMGRRMSNGFDIGDDFFKLNFNQDNCFPEQNFHLDGF